jgi:exosome complex RNA-binding protein Rrp42 (RNase PH superfamily)
MASVAGDTTVDDEDCEGGRGGSIIIMVVAAGVEEAAAAAAAAALRGIEPSNALDMETLVVGIVKGAVDESVVVRVDALTIDADCITFASVGS